MDIFAHTLWTNIVYYRKYRTEVRNRTIAVLFGIVPDIFSFAPIFIYQFATRIDFFELINKNIWVVRYAEVSYKYTHSIIIFALTLFLVASVRAFWYTLKNNDRLNLVYVRKFIYWPMFGWLLHILIDIPTHRDFYETPFLFPISDYQFGHGVSWGTPWFMILNYSALTLVYLYWFLVLRKK